MLPASAFAGPCDPPNNEIVCENSKAGSSPSQWDVNGDGDPNIQGFATDISVDQGQTVRFKVKTPSTAYHLDIYRMGYYGGNGARKITAVSPSVSLPQSQPACKEEASTGLVDCGNWAESASWAVPASVVSGIYFAKLVREDQPSSEGSHVVFVVRDDDGASDLLFQTSDTTWQAYNEYGGKSLYTGGPGTSPSRAYKVSYNRPMTTRDTNPEDAWFNAEYPMVRWLERNGYDVSYSTGIDGDRHGAEILEHDALLSVGHDEYWSGAQRANVEAARNAGVNLAFFSGNEVFWKTRWENSIAGPATSYRTLVCYKETHANAKTDPAGASMWTGTWRDPRFSPPADGGRPENELTGTSFAVNAGTTAIQVPGENAGLRLWRDTDIAELGLGETATLGEDTLGYEWDEDPDNGFRPDGLVPLSSTTDEVPQKLLDYGSSYGPGEVTHHLTMYRAPSDALVFGAGTVQWSWGLDGEHDRGNAPPDSRMQQATVNLFADMGVQPGTLQAGLVAATESTDVDPPTTSISTPIDDMEVSTGQPFTVKGHAADFQGEANDGGEIGAVEVSVDEGETWHPAEGTDPWSYEWTPAGLGEATVMARAVDDSGNLETTPDEVTVDVVAHACPCTIWDKSFTGPQDNDSKAIELGVKFRSDVPGFISGIRFYKTSANTGTHIGRLWTSTGTQLGQVTFTGESATGWQEAHFETPIAINANTTYIASYHAPVGRYASIQEYFELVGTDNPPLHALADGADGPNGIYKYGSAGGLFASGGPNTFHSENYLVDVVLEKQLAPDTEPPVIGSRSPVDKATEVGLDVSASAAFNEAINPATISGSTVQLKDPLGTLVPAVVTYDSGQHKATLDPNESLEYGTTYTATVKGGPGGIADVAGNQLAASSSWSFTTVAPPPPPPNEGPGGPILVIASSGNSFSRYYAEILRAEGLNAFTVTEITNVSPALLANYDVAILGEEAVSAGQTTTLTNWVQAGGNLIAMRPESKLASLLGIASAGGTLANAYMKVDTGTAPGTGIVGQTIQFHGTADRYTTAGAQTIASLYSNASTSTPNPAVTLRDVGTNGGQAAAFTYDLAKSIIYTRQGNPLWDAEERDGLSPVRSNDLFYGNKAGDVQPDWVDLNKVAIPQADEQQRLLTNLIERMNVDRKPLPRFWFLPEDHKAAVVLTGDDHANNGTTGRFEHLKTLDPPGCVVAKWQCVRMTSYIYSNTPITDAKAASFVADGFEVGVHITTGCRDWDDQPDLESVYSSLLGEFANKFPSVPSPTTNRMHCIVWSDWGTQPKVELKNGIRLDTTYYYWPAAWVQNRPGMFTGSGMPMRFANPDGTLIDVYQAATQMTDESAQTYPFNANELLDKALGPEGYYGAFVANMHTDKVVLPESDAIIASAQARGVPIITARQLLTWLDGRNQSTFGSVAWSGNNLTFAITPGAGASGLRAMVPTTSAIGSLATIKRGGTPVAITKRTIKGIEYAFFDATAGSYTASYMDEQLPEISNVQAQAKNDGTATVTWDTSEPTTSRVDYGTSAGSLPFNVSNPALVSAHSLQLSGLEPNVTYHYRVTSVDGETNSVTEPEPPLSPKTFVTPPGAPVLSSTAPASPANQNSPKVVGSAAAGTTVNLYTTSNCSGSPVATGTAAALATGITVSVADNSTTSFRATATSGGGASACSAPLAYVEDSGPPDTTIDTKPAALANSTTAKFTFSGNDGAGSGIASFECRIDAGAWAACTSPREYTSLAEGAHTFEVKAIDKAGNVDASPATFGWTIDSKAPETQIDTKPAALVKAATATFTFSGSDVGGSGVASFECRRDGGAWAACTSPREYTGLAEGAHTFEVKAIDQAGHVDATPATYGWTVDTAAPDTTIGTKPAALANSATANFTFSGSDGSGSGIASFECRIDAGAWGACTSPREYTGLSQGSHTFDVKATDQAGNVDATPATYTWTVDTGAPDTTIGTKPAALANSANAKFEFTGNDGSGSGIASFECRIDAGAWAACTSPREYTGLSQSAHTFDVKAIDKAGNTDATPATYNWQIDLTAPAVTIDSLSKALLKAGETSDLTWHADENGSFELRVGGADCTAGTVVASGSYSTKPAQHVSNVTAAQLAEGANTLRLCVTDAAGNRGSATTTLSKDTGAPDTTIGAKPAALANTAIANFTFSGNDGTGSGIASFECRIDSGSWGACTSPREYTSLAEAAHTFEVKAIDQAGNVDATPATYSWTVDSKAPDTTIDTKPAVFANSTTANFTFSGSDTSGSGVASFQCRRDSSEAADWQPCVSPLNYTSLAEGAHSFEVRAIDQAGNVDATPATFTWTVDSKAPETQIDTKPASLVKVTTANFTFSGNDGTGSGIASFECRIDSGAWGVCTSPREYTSLAEGAHTFDVKAIDKAGNADASPATFTWTVDSKAPETQIDTKPASLVKVTTANFTFSGNDGTGSGIASFECRRDGGAWAACTSPREYTGLAEGAHTFEVKAIDTAGNVDATPATYDWTVDSQAPDTTIGIKPAALANSANAKFEFTGNDGTGSGIASFECRLDSGSWVACTSPREYTGLSQGAHSFEVKAIDQAGNVDATPATYGWTVDTAAPDTTIGTKPAALANSSTANFTFSGNDGSGSGIASFECRIDAGAWGACTSPREYTSLAEGAHTFDVKAIDQAGNVDATPASFSWTVDSKAPETQIDTKPAALGTSTTANFTFSGSDSGGSGIASFECRRDGGAWATCTSPQQYSALPDGAHTFEVKAIDQAGNVDSSPASFNWTIDTTAPQTQVDSGPNAVAATAGAVFTFSGNDGSGSGIASFECRRDGEDWVTCSSPKTYNALAEGAHTFDVKAIDQVGNVDQTPASHVWTIDTSAPDTTIGTKPAALANSATANFAFSGNDGSGSGIASFECRIDSGAWAACASPREYTGLGAGSHAFDVKAIDNAGNVDQTPATYNWQIDLTAPAVTIDSLSKALLKAGETSDLTWHADENGSFELRVGGADCAAGTVVASGAYSTQPATRVSGVTAAQLAEGPNTLRLCVTDAAGNRGQATTTLSKDTGAPDTTIGTKPAALANSTTANFTFSGNDGTGSGIASFECRIDSGSWGVCTSPREYTGLSQGAHSFEVKAIDNAGNVDATPATYSWAVDTAAPDTTIGTKPAALANSATANFTFSGNDGTGSGIASFECRIDSGAWGACTSPREYTGLSQGSHTFEVKAIDQAGNVDATPVTFGWTIDTVPPAVQVDSGPAGLTGDTTPTFTFSSEPGANFQCSIDTGTPGFGPCSGAGTHTPSSPLDDGPYTFRVRATDAATNQATATRSFSVETAAPPAPQLSSTDPLSPANDNTPQIIGTAPADTTVKLYTSVDCSGSPVATGSAIQLEAGIVVSVPDNSTTSVRATATTALDNVSGCSEPIAYVEDSSPPDTTIGTKPAALANSATANFAFSGNDGSGSGIASFECRIDSGSWAACASPREYTGLGAGSHAFDVKAIDNAGNVDQTPATYNWQIDLTAPAVTIDSLSKALLKAGETSDLTWHADENGSFELRVGGVDCTAGTVVASGSYSNKPAQHVSNVTAAQLAEGANTLRLCVTDAAGNRGQATTTLSKDTGAPDTTIGTKPAALANSATANFAFSGNDGSGSGIASFECRIDSGSWAACASPREYTGLGAGSHTFDVKAIDNAGNVDQTPATYNWQIDLTAPAVTIDSLSKALLKAGETSDLTWHADENGSFELRVGGADCAAGTVVASGAYSTQPATRVSGVTAAQLAEGPNTLRLCVTDAAGNRGQATTTLNKDTGAPDTTINTKPAALASSTTANFTFSGNDGSGSGVASFECRLDSGAWGVCTSPREYTSLAEGAHTFDVKAIDQAGNVDATPATYSWTVDSQAPDTTIGTKPAALVNSTTANFTFSGNDGAGSGIASFECRIDSGSWAACASPREYTGLGAGAHTFDVKAIDNAGNVDQTPATYNWQIDLTAPAVTIDSLSKALLKAGETSDLTWHADENGSFELRVGGADCAAGTVVASGAYSTQPATRVSGVTAAQLAEGANTLRLCLTDAAGNRGQATTTLNKDTGAPDTTINTKPAALASSTTANFTFSGNDGSGSGVASFECRLDSGAWGVCTSPREYTSLAEGAHTFEVKAIDQAGNADGSPATYSWTVDTTPPVVQIDSGPSGLTNDSTPTFTFSSEPGAAFQCSIDTGTPSFGPCSGTGTHTPASPLSDGPHTFRVRATDVATNQATATRSFSVDTAAPSGPELTATTPASPANDNNPKVIGTAPAGTTIKLYTNADCSGSPVATGTAAQLEAGISVSVADNSTTSFRATSTTVAENVSGCSDPIAYVEDSSAPDTTIGTKPATLVNSTTANFTFSGNDGTGSGIASFECRLDSGAWGVCTSPLEYTGLSQGSHTFEVKAIDKAGNTDATPATYTWQIDLTAPAVTIDSLSKALLKAGETSDLTWHADENGSFELRVGGADCTAGTVVASGAYSNKPAQHVSNVTAAQLAEGANTLRLCVTDAAGNRGQATTTLSKDTGAPDTTINTKPAALASSTTANFTFSGNDGSGSGVASFECRIDSGAWAACTSPREYTSLAEGSHTFDVKAIDQAGNLDGSPATYSWTVDTVGANTTIDTKPPALSTSTSANFTFSGSDTGGSGVASFECRRDADAWAPCTSPRSYSALAEGSHSFEARAIDVAGNPDPTPAAFNWSIDSQSPETQIDTKPAVLVKTSAANFTFSGSDPGGSGLASFECRRDGGAWAACTSPREYTSLTEGAHSFEVKAIDQAGNADATPAAYSWTVDTASPDTTIDTKPASLVKVTTANFAFSGNDGSGSGIASFECRIDSGSWAACTSPREYTGLTEGSHTFEVKAIDNAGNTDGSPATYSWTIDTTPPVVQIDSGPSGLTNDSTPTFTFSSEPGAAFQCSIDTGTPSFGPCSGTGTHTPASPLSDGPHTFRVRATDVATNQATATRSFSVDTAAPSGPELTATVPASPANNNNPKVIGTAPAGTTIKLYTSADCSGSPVATGTVAQLEVGISVSVPDNSTTNFRATSTTVAENVSGCSDPIAYVEDSSAPDTTIGTKPAALMNSTAANFTFSGNDGAGSGIASFECRIDSGSWGACASSKEYTGLSAGAHTFDVKAIDQASNVDQTPATYNWQIDLTAPAVTIDSLSKALLKAGETSDLTWHADENGSFELRVGGADCAAGMVVASGAYSTQPATRVSGVTAAQLAEGANTLRLCLTDAAGNRGQATTTLNKDTGAPDTTINTKPAALASSTTATFTFSGNDGSGSGVASFECRLDSGAWGVCTSPREYTSLAEGAHTFEIKAIDQAGNVDGSPATYSWTVDSQAPETQIDTKPAALSTSTTASFTFSAADGAGSGVASYQCRRDSEDWTLCTSPRSFSALAEGSHSFEVRAIDVAGNVDQTPAAFDWEIDSKAPNTQIDTKPTLLANSSTASFGFSASDPGGSGVASFECRIDSGAWAACTTPRQYTGLTDGAHSFEVKAIDEAGHVDATPASFTWSIDSQSPETQIDTKPAALVKTTTANFTFSGSDAGGSGVASFECRRDGGAWAACTSPREYTGLGDGAHSFDVRALDNAGNADTTPATFSWTVDTTAPAVQIDSGPSGQTDNPSPTFGFSSEPGASFQCSIDTGTPNFGPCSAANAHTPAAPLADGPHTFRVRATDAATNQAIATRAFSVDTAAPDAPQLTATDPVSPANDNTPQIVGTAAAGTTIKLYTNADCSGSPVATGTVTELEAGISVSVPDNSTTNFRATSTTAAENVSGCSDPIAYVEDSGAPDTTIDAKPASLTASANFTFTGSDGAGSGLASFECRRDSTDPGAWAPCASPKAYTGLSDGGHVFEVRAIDNAGNADASPAAFAWTVDTSPSQQTPPQDEPSSPPVTPKKPALDPAELIRVLRDPKKGTALLVFKVPGPGLLSARPPEISLSRTNSRKRTVESIRKLRLRQRQIKPKSIRVTRAGEVTVPIVLTAAGKKLLSQSHRLKVKVVINYRATDGSKATWKIAVTLKKKTTQVVTQSRHGK